MIYPRRQVLRVSAWFCVALLAYLSLIPGDLQNRTGAPGQLEHMVAYFGTAVLFTLGYPLKRLQIAVGLVAYGISLELLQAFSPGRTAQIIDACASGSGAIPGFAAMVLLGKRLRNRPTNLG